MFGQKLLKCKNSSTRVNKTQTSRRNFLDVGWDFDKRAANCGRTGISGRKQWGNRGGILPGALLSILISDKKFERIPVDVDKDNLLCAGSEPAELPPRSFSFPTNPSKCLQLWQLRVGSLGVFSRGGALAANQLLLIWMWRQPTAYQSQLLVRSLLHSRSSPTTASRITRCTWNPWIGKGFSYCHSSVCDVVVFICHCLVKPNLKMTKFERFKFSNVFVRKCPTQTCISRIIRAKRSPKLWFYACGFLGVWVDYN